MLQFIHTNKTLHNNVVMFQGNPQCTHKLSINLVKQDLFLMKEPKVKCHVLTDKELDKSGERLEYSSQKPLQQPVQKF